MFSATNENFLSNHSLFHIVLAIKSKFHNKGWSHIRKLLNPNLCPQEPLSEASKMGSEHFPLHNRGIYHNLPTFDPSITNLSAIVTGANGISGFHTMRVLLQNPQRWSKIYALSRRPPPAEMMALLPEDQRSRVKHVACDFLEPPEAIAKTLMGGNVSATHIFFYSYLQPKPSPGDAAWSNADELVKVNGTLLENFLNALPLANISPTRILLQTGAKNYGMHIGRVRTPCIESDPQPKHLEPNFYYKQEATLFEFCKAHPNTSWNVVMPAWILGAVNNAQMNALHPFAIYAAVQAQKNEPLFFPSDWTSWQDECHHSTAMLTGYLSEWAVLEDKCKNEAFNSQDTSPLSWDRVYEELVRWFGVEKGIVRPEDSESRYTVVKGRSGKQTPMGYVCDPML
jgi:nucleoside-diphosphate-sugar epimerase